MGLETLASGATCRSCCFRHLRRQYQQRQACRESQRKRLDGKMQKMIAGVKRTWWMMKVGACAGGSAVRRRQTDRSERGRPSCYRLSALYRPSMSSHPSVAAKSISNKNDGPRTAAYAPAHGHAVYDRLASGFRGLRCSQPGSACVTIGFGRHQEAG